LEAGLSPAEPAADELGRERRALEIFGEICALPAPDRAAALEKRCSHDPLLRLRVATLLGADANPVASLHSEHGVGAFLGAEIRRIRGSDNDASQPDGAPARVPAHYRIIGVLGEGGMATVYEAEQVHPRRRVAIKVIRAGLFSAELRRRFEYEAHILAQLQHPGIAQLYEAETRADHLAGHPGVHCYLSMELVRGLPIDEHAARHNLDVFARLKLFLRVFEAVEYAHRKGVVHRDLKPANILIDSGGRPKILDFGVARAVEPAPHASGALTGAGPLVGTLAYMSPEQVDPRLGAVDTRCDVYALGVVLYELLCGALPLDVANDGIAAAMGRICHESPIKIGARDRRFRGDLEVIVAKALEKDPERRYHTVEALADDVRRFLDGRAIEARADSAWYVLAKASRRFRMPLTLAAVGVILVIAFAVYAQRQAARTRRLLDEAMRMHDMAQPRASDEITASLVSLSEEKASHRRRIDGVIISAGGLVLTTEEVETPVGGAINITTANGETMTGRILEKTPPTGSHASVTLIQLPPRASPWPTPFAK
jgi:hypothetical protein